MLVWLVVWELSGSAIVAWAGVIMDESSVLLFSVSDVLLVLEVIVLVDSVSISKIESVTSVVFSIVRSTIV